MPRLRGYTSENDARVWSGRHPHILPGLPDFPDSILRPDVPREEAFGVSSGEARAKLDQNESPVDLPEPIRDVILEHLRSTPLHRYPQPDAYRRIKEQFGAAIGQPAERIILTAGADQLILLAFWAAGGEGRRARVFEPTYPLYAAQARNTQTELDRVVLGPSYKLEDLGGAVNILVLCRPNNPTGSSPGEEVVARAAKYHSLVVLDEAYADFSGDSLAWLGEENANLLVIRSLSKAGLAGVRLGYGLGHPQLIQILETMVFAPYHLNALQLAVAAAHAEIRVHVEGLVRQITAERERVQEELGSMGVRYWHSETNFVLFEAPRPSQTNERLLGRGVRVRDVSDFPGLSSHLRVTIGTPQENDLFLRELKPTV